MNELWADPKVWIAVGGVVCQAAITWQRVKQLEANQAKMREQLEELMEFRAVAMDRWNRTP